MIIGLCPHCGKTLIAAMPPRTPAVRRATCSECGAVHWLVASRLESFRMTEAAFRAKYDLDEVAGTFVERESVVVS